MASCGYSNGKAHRKSSNTSSNLSRPAAAIMSANRMLLSVPCTADQKYRIMPSAILRRSILIIVVRTPAIIGLVAFGEESAGSKNSPVQEFHDFQRFALKLDSSDRFMRPFDRVRQATTYSLGAQRRMCAGDDPRRDPDRARLERRNDQHLAAGARLAMGSTR
jgi:hypothetical protein